MHILDQGEFGLDDLTFPPPDVVSIDWSEVDLTTQLTKRISLACPLIGSPMDTVTESEMAILLARLGGIGVIHNNLSIEQQMWEVEKVRRYEGGFVRDPIVLAVNATLKEYYEYVHKYKFSSYPVTKNGLVNSPLMGIITENDVYDYEDLTMKVADLMTPVKKMVLARREDTLDKNDIRSANKIIRSKKLGLLPIVDKNLNLIAMVTRSDIMKNRNNPLATKDDNKQLKVMVAVEARLNDLTKARIDACKQMGVSGIVIDQRNVSLEQLKTAKWAKQHAPEMDIMVGNLVTASSAKAILDEYGEFVDAFRIGIGGGEVCTTTENIGIGRALLSSIRDIKEVVEQYKKKLGHIGIVGDGGIKTPAHVLAVMLLGADAAMMGSLLAGLKESPGKPELIEDLGKMVKKVRGMGSAAVIKERAGASRYMVDLTAAEDRIPEGKEKYVSYKGEGDTFLRLFLNGVRNGLHGLNCKNFAQLQEKRPALPRRVSASKGVL